MTAGPAAPTGFCWLDIKTRDLPGTGAFLAAALDWRCAVDEDDWRRATKISTADGHPVGGVSDLAQPVYPPGTPAHIAYYLAVDDLDRRTDRAVARGAELVVPPFDAGDQGRLATLVDPVGAAVSLWQPYRFGGWRFPPGSPGTPHRMVLTCERPDRARDFYREVTGTDVAHADFTAAATGSAAPRWELTVGADDPTAVAARVHAHGRGRASWPDDPDRSVLRLTSPDGLTLRVVRARGRI
ncbi:VOC family protein [Streptomyces griseiscabiei]|uniref:VOC family protein n=1 Tax=Streptomyces griseiscabiei TaxID=2993540 RepID=A0ABU4KXA8_9ACTN|nr:VOC family protein [Streptomyces griseiscabiei]MBZ3903333.1 VOC family protein [Streptomyces griseiscabiei]MDX2907644.1 VOC family protein [Streptomyces griseiscabiei]